MPAGPKATAIKAQKMAHAPRAEAALRTAASSQSRKDQVNRPRRDRFARSRRAPGRSSGSTDILVAHEYTAPPAPTRPPRRAGHLATQSAGCADARATRRHADLGF